MTCVVDMPAVYFNRVLPNSAISALFPSPPPWSTLPEPEGKHGRFRTRTRRNGRKARAHTLPRLHSGSGGILDVKRDSRPLYTAGDRNLAGGYAGSASNHLGGDQRSQSALPAGYRRFLQPVVAQRRYPISAPDHPDTGTPHLCRER